MSERSRRDELAATVVAPGTASPEGRIEPGGETESGPVPTRIAGRYEILGLLGAGGMGTVYKVRDHELDEIVALKTLRREWIDAPGALDRFKREVKLARRVTHKNVARTFDLGDAGAEKFLTMEYVEGTSLARAIDERGALPLAEALRIAGAIAEALEAAHAAGVVHRDLKPDNVLLGRPSVLEGGRVVVTDFGIARVDAGSGDAAMTAAGQAIGTPAYMAPEQVEGAPIDARADLYALGLVLYEMLTGQRAFSGDSPLAIAAARLVQPPPDASRVRRDLPPDLAALAKRLLARRAADRPGSAAEVRAALAAIEPASSRSSLRPSAPPVSLPEVVRSLAVMPLRAAGPPEDAWIAEGFTDDLLDALCSVRGLRVKARADAEPGETPRAFGERLEVELVVEGSARKEGEGIRVALRLTSVHDGFQVWAQRYQCGVGDLLVIGDRAADEIGRAVGSVATPEAKAPERFGVPSEAIELYLRARTETRSFLDLSPQIDLLERAVHLAPREPRLLAALAIARARETFRPGAVQRTTVALAQETADRAVELAPELAEPWIALAHVRNAGNDTPGAMRALKRALRQGPSVAEAYDLAGRLLAEVDRFDEALRLLERALWFEPRLAFARIDRARIHALRGDWDAVARTLDELREASPTHYVLTAPRMSIWSGRKLFHETDAGGLAEFAQTFVHVFRKRIATGAIDTEARDTMRSIVDQTAPISRARRLFQQLRAELHASVGDLPEAICALEGATAGGLEDIAWVDRCPVLAPLRGDPRFAAQRAIVAERAAAVQRAWDSD